MAALCIEINREDDGRVIAEIADLPGVIEYGDSEEDGLAKVQARAAPRYRRPHRERRIDSRYSRWFSQYNLTHEQLAERQGATT
jgi:hypothetical protein